jgi:hypothetical protein
MSGPLEPPVLSSSNGTGEEPAAPAPYFGSMLEWFEEWLRPTYRRSTHGELREWCEEWWQHAEALSRLDALWRAWEALRLDAGTGLSVWWRDHADHHLAALLDPDGPFKACGDGHVDNSPEELRHVRPPAAMYAQVEDLDLSPGSGEILHQPAAVSAEAAGQHMTHRETPGGRTR